MAAAKFFVASYIGDYWISRKVMIESGETHKQCCVSLCVSLQRNSMNMPSPSLDNEKKPVHHAGTFASVALTPPSAHTQTLI